MKKLKLSTLKIDSFTTAASHDIKVKGGSFWIDCAPSETELESDLCSGHFNCKEYKDKTL